MKREEFLQELNQILTPENYHDVALNGLQVSGHHLLKKVCFAVTATLNAIEKAIAEKAQALVVHHGLFWSPQGPLAITGVHGEKIKKLLDHQVNLFAYHLPLDGHLQYGNAAGLARLLELQQPAPFPQGKKESWGISGYFKTPQSLESLAKKLETHLHYQPQITLQRPKHVISSLAIITGAAKSEWRIAKQAGFDAYLTGEISLEHWYAAQEDNFPYIVAGHHATERFGVQALCQLFAEKGLETSFIDCDCPI